MVTYTDGDKIKSTWEDITRDGENSWMTLKYVGKEELDLSGVGTGGYDEFMEQLPEDDIVFGGFRVYGVDEDGENPRTKLIVVAWVPPGVKGLKRARAGPHKGDVMKMFHGYHVSIEANSKDDLAKETLEGKLNASTGSHKPASYKF